MRFAPFSILSPAFGVLVLLGGCQLADGPVTDIDEGADLPRSEGRMSDPAAPFHVDVPRTQAQALEGDSALVPTVVGCAPGNDAALDSSIACDVDLVGSGVDAETLTPSTVVLSLDGAQVPCRPGTSGGRDAITCTPTTDLLPNQTYAFHITSGVKDEDGHAFAPFDKSFTTTDTGLVPLSEHTFSRRQVYEGEDFCFSIAVGPDGRLYCASMGKIIRWDLNADGSLGRREVYEPSFLTDDRGPRLVIGLAFRSATELWISDNASLVEPAPDFSGRITRLTWYEGEPFSAALVVAKVHVTSLPRSARDHLSNSLAFHGDYLYLSQGSNSAMGQAQNDAWRNRPEHLLSAAILRIDPRGPGCVDVRTPDGGGTYDPSAPDARVKIYATGVRNAYDLVWHSNGLLYAATNGSAAGGSTPTCSGAPALRNVSAQNDYLFRIVEGGYYGHPNPVRNQCVMNRGNLNNHPDGGDVVREERNNGYLLGQQPDPNYRGFAFNFGLHKSPNGTLEYHRGPLAGRLVVTRWSAGDDIILFPAPAWGLVESTQVRRLACEGRFDNPIDLAENLGGGARNGQLYVSEMIVDGPSYTGRIQLCTPNF